MLFDHLVKKEYNLNLVIKYKWTFSGRKPPINRKVLNVISPYFSIIFDILKLFEHLDGKTLATITKYKRVQCQIDHNKCLTQTQKQCLGTYT